MRTRLRNVTYGVGNLGDDATLAIVESMHLHSADNVVLNFADLIGKLERIFTARSERRIFTAASERRIFKDE